MKKHLLKVFKHRSHGTALVAQKSTHEAAEKQVVPKHHTDESEAHPPKKWDPCDFYYY